MRSTHFALTLISSALLSCASSQTSNARAYKPDELKQISAEAYVYAYPMVVLATTRDVMTAVPRPSRDRAPMNQIANRRLLPDENTTQIYADSDTLGSFSWLDLSTDPVVISLPDAGKRFVMFSLISAWGEVFASPGSRTLGNQKKNIVITGPGWNGQIPADMQRIVAPTNSVWMVGRAQLNGKGDYDRVYGYQDKLKLTTLSQFGKNTQAPMTVPFNIDVDSRTPVLEQVENMDARVFFATFAEELKKNPPAQADAKIVSKLSALGIVPGKDLNYDTLPMETKNAMNSGYFLGQEEFAHFQRGKTPNLKMSNGWGRLVLAGQYGTNYETRALMTKLGLGTVAPQDIALAQGTMDEAGDRLNGSYKYILHFTKDQAPPVQGFWSVSMYNTRKFPVANPLGRFAINSHDQLKKNSDGSTDIYVQSISPGKDREANWLPAPAGEEFNLVMRMYWPSPAVLDGSWKIPGLQKVPEFKNLSENLY